MAARNPNRKPRKKVPIVGEWHEGDTQHRKWCARCHKAFRQWYGPSHSRGELITCPACGHTWGARFNGTRDAVMECECGQPLRGQSPRKGCLECQRVVSRASAQIEAMAGMRDIHFDRLDVYASRAAVDAGAAAFWARPRYDNGLPRVEPIGASWGHWSYQDPATTGDAP